jgi:hypothetical protein
MKRSSSTRDRGKTKANSGGDARKDVRARWSSASSSRGRDRVVRSTVLESQTKGEYK